jgi:hypothetical protein
LYHRRHFLRFSKWKTGKKEYIGNFLVCPVIVNDTLYGGGHLCYFYSIDPATLGVKWKFSTSNPIPSEWHKVGFEEKLENDKKKYYRPSMTSEKIVYVQGKPIVQEQKFDMAYTSGSTTYFKSGAYGTGSSAEYQNTRRKKEL